jgi:Icc-related predicted phosphoesterase
MRIVAISDTHMRHHKIAVPEGDVLVHAGDFTKRGSMKDVDAFNTWLGTLPHRHKLVIAGNHDWAFQKTPAEARAALNHATYLEDEGVELDGVRFWGSPWQPWFLSWAFNLQRGAEIAQKWALIPARTDVLITHGPPLGFGDRCVGGEEVGCADLLARIRELRPRAHIFGHIHEGSGVRTDEHTTYVNASVLDVAYEVAYPPRVIDL